MNKTLFSLAIVAVAVSAQAQTFSPTLGQGATLDQQVIGDTSASADRTQSTSIQQGNSANQLGNSLGNNVDTRDQNTVNSAGGSATGGTANGNHSANDNRSSVGNTSSSSGGNNLSNGGNTTGGNTMVGGSTGGNTLSNGSSSGGNTMTGGANTAQGGAGGSSSSNGTNAQGQAQGIDRSGNSANSNANGQGQQQANNGTNAQGQTSANTNTAGGNTGGNSRNSQATTTTAGNGAGAGAGSGNRTENRTNTALAVDASDRSSTVYESRAVAWAPVIHGPAAAPLAAANLVVVPGKCGPRMMVVSKNIVGQRFKSILPDSTFDQTTSDRLVTLTDGNGNPLPPFENRGGFLMGHEVTILATTIGTSTAGSISLGIFGKSNDAAQGGSSSSGSVQQIVKEIELRECVFAMPKADAPTPPADRTHAPAPKADRN